MTDWLPSINESTRDAVAEVIKAGLDEGLAGPEIASRIESIPAFDDARLQVVAAISPEPDPMLELGKAVLALAGRESITNVHVAPAAVTVSAPSVTVEAAKAAPIVIPAPVVNVNPTVGELRITGMPERVTSRKIERDKAGKITRTIDVESDG